MTTNSPADYHSIVLPFEKNFDPRNALRWMDKNWHSCFYYSAIYLFVIFSIKRIMTNYKPFQLTKLLLAWNILLATFSIVTFCRLLPEFIYVMQHHGIYGSVCIPTFLDTDTVSAFWTLLFVLSKVPEFGDTLFIVLRKQPLIFLHWYHHILTAIYSWYAFKELTPSSRWFCVMNSFVHSFMYSYFALKSLKVRIPKVIAVTITSSQILQMVAGVYVNYKTYQYLSEGAPCPISRVNVFLSSLMYFSYFVLFCNFFYHAYFSRNKKQKSN